ncbi:PREDICTED: uncharacterized protein LOC108365814 isoform X2 [Rhagoletis zephyria]|uniref:uncharacterized protein LOC108361760 isoform X2 n=1 Tax=Rhagoletis zephyria TaxID=28612 RepID=UPI00081135C4|nr:PREDICTED: uncharacterized protein LOC108361760 isoform X2 [Rhagoletis zephyria]XP_017475485.1 PREDICTED: uncharacterized protein LOC108365814 isoform X2 [Rhagoletis zephyria]
MFEEKLIAEIEKHNCLWDKRQLSYRDRVKKDLAWRNVAAAVGHPEENCRKRWKSVLYICTTSIYILNCNLYVHILRTTTNIVSQTPEVLGQEPDILDTSFGFQIGESGNIIIEEQETTAPTPAKRQKKKNDENAAFNDLVNEVSQFVDSQKKTHNNFLGAIGEVFEKVPEESRLDFQMDVLQYVYAQYKNYKN